MQLPPLTADLILIHPPAYFDFRGCRRVYFPFPGSSGDVPITPLYEYFPLGFKSLQCYLADRGYEVKIINLASLLVQYPELDFAAIADALDARLVGIDLHWMVHVQGALSVAETIKWVRKDLPLVFGGISATCYSQELIRYPFVDMVMRGYDTHLPLEMLLRKIKAGSKPTDVSNLLWKDRGRIVDNGYTFKPDSCGYRIDWSHQPQRKKSLGLPIAEIVSATSVGCRFDCKWCGGSKSAFKRLHGRSATLVYRSLDHFSQEMASLSQVSEPLQYHVYPVGTYNESEERLDRYLEILADSRIRSLSFELFTLGGEEILRKMVRASPRTSITLSPDTHDQRIAKKIGKGCYTNQELEAWIDKALGIGISQIDLWYLVGLPDQDEDSVMKTIEYACRLLERFDNHNVNPMICPMLPILDPASTFFEQPGKYGYRIFCRSIEDHRRAMGRASLINRLNYETRWLRRKDLVRVGYLAIRQLMEAKVETGFLPASRSRFYISKLDDAMAFMEVVHEVDLIRDPLARETEFDKIGDEIQKRNDELLYSGVLNQAFPFAREIGGRWIDEIGWDREALEAVVSSPA
jgi:clorobiocin biosynthesis protein CloN6